MNKESSPKTPQELFQTILQANKESVPALEDLSLMAMGGFQEARDLIHQLEQQDGELALPFPSPNPDLKSKTPKAKRTMMPPEHPFY